MRLRVLIAVAVLVPAIAGGEATDYRLAGVLSVSEGRSLAIIEKSPGNAVLVSVGDHVDGGEVMAIGPSFVKLRFDRGDVQLTLAGAPGGALDVPQSTAAVDTGADAGTAPRTVPIKQTLLALDRIEASLPATNAVEDGKASHGPREELAAEDEEAGKQLATALAGLFRLPKDVAIASINGETFGSAKEGLAKVMRNLGDGQVVRFEMQQNPDHPTLPVYVAPQ